MIEATLGVVVRPGEILLGEKKRGKVGVGFLSGPGGVQERGETLEECLLRETREELRVELDPASFVQMALIDFHVARVLDFRVYVFLAKILSGEPQETADMVPHWYPVSQIPFYGLATP